jgi:cell division protein FtsN
MKRNYPSHTAKRSRSSNRGQFMLVCMAFATGYLSSGVFNISQLGQWLDQSLIHIGGHAKPVTSMVEAKKDAPISHQPKLEFYTVLTKEDKHVIPVTATVKEPEPQVSTPEAKPVEATKPELAMAEKPVEVATAKPVEAPPAAKPEVKKGNYFVQLASFRYYAQAEKFKAKLILKGFDVKISAIRQGTMQWYRVMLGPYSSISEAQKAKVIFQAKEHAPGMIRQMDA